MQKFNLVRYGCFLKQGCLFTHHEMSSHGSSLATGAVRLLNFINLMNVTYKLIVIVICISKISIDL